MSGKKRRDIPRFGQAIIETHCHLDYLDEDTLPEVLEQAHAVGVERIVTIAVSPDNLRRVRALAAAHPRIWCTQGIHPHEAGKFNSGVETAIREAATADPRVVAIGEIGLDYYYDHAERSAQRHAFSRQLALAAELDLPVVIHSRDADEDMRAMLAEHVGALPRRGVIHSFSSGLLLAEYCLEADFYLGFNGMVTFNSADNVRAAVAMTPLSRLLLETDAPYLTPVPYRGHSNAPCYLPFIAEKIAEVQSRPVEEVLEACHYNSLALFFPADAASEAAA